MHPQRTMIMAPYRHEKQLSQVGLYPSLAMCSAFTATGISFAAFRAAMHSPPARSRRSRGERRREESQAPRPGL